jgi:hypothetical protein
MKKRIIIISLAVLFIGLGLTFALHKGASRGAVYLEPPSLNVQRGQELSINITAEPSGWGVSGCEVNLTFNSSVLQGVNIEVGEFLGSSPLIGLEDIDNEAGVVRLVMARLGMTTAPSPPGVLATVNFTVSDSAESGTYELKLTKVGLANQDFEDVTDFAVRRTVLTVSP